MPRYYFDVLMATGGHGVDDDGTEFEKLEDARQEALRTLGAMASFDLRTKDHFETSIEIRDNRESAALCSVSLSTR